MYITKHGFVCRDCSEDFEFQDILNVRSVHIMYHEINIVNNARCDLCNALLTTRQTVQSCDSCTDELYSLIVSRAFKKGWTISY